MEWTKISMRDAMRHARARNTRVPPVEKLYPPDGEPRERCEMQGFTDGTAIAVVSGDHDTEGYSEWTPVDSWEPPTFWVRQ